MPKQQIRLARLHRSGSIAFEVHSLHSVEHKYIALSYAWNEATDEEGPHYLAVFNSGQCSRVGVQFNLWSFLQHEKLRLSTSGLYWFDALCIDQQNLTEKKDQVAIMGDIYREADKVLVWLGPNRDLDVLYGWWTGDYLRQDFQDFKCSEWESTEDFADHRITGITGILPILRSRLYWNRMWTVQEFMLARDIEICFGKIVMDYIKFLNTFCLDCSNHDITHVYGMERSCFQSSPPNFTQIFKLRNGEDWELGLDVQGNTTTRHKLRSIYRALRLLSSGRACGEVRDYVYSLLALLSKDCGSSKLQADYTLSRTELLIRVLRLESDEYVLDLGTLLWKNFALSKAIFQKELSNSEPELCRPLTVSLDEPVKVTAMWKIPRDNLDGGHWFVSKLNQIYPTFLFSTCPLSTEDLVLSIVLDDEEGILALICRPFNLDADDVWRTCCHDFGLKTSNDQLPSSIYDTDAMIAEGKRSFVGTTMIEARQNESGSQFSFVAMLEPSSLTYLIDPSAGYLHWKSGKLSSLPLINLG